MGIKEYEFWDMTIAELDRVIKSKTRLKVEAAQERATFDYIQADLIGYSISRLFSNSATYPEISSVYPTLFDTKEIQEQKQAKLAELSALRFKQFAQSYSNKYKEVAKDNDE